MEIYIKLSERIVCVSDIGLLVQPWHSDNEFESSRGTGVHA